MKLSLHNYKRLVSGQGAESYHIELKLETMDGEQYTRILDAIQDAVPEPKAVEEKQPAMGFRIESEDSDTSPT